MSTLSRRIIILLLYTDCQGGRTAAIARHVSFSQITCLLLPQLRTHERGDAQHFRSGRKVFLDSSMKLEIAARSVTVKLRARFIRTIN